MSISPGEVGLVLVALGTLINAAVGWHDARVTNERMDELDQKLQDVTESTQYAHRDVQYLRQSVRSNRQEVQMAVTELEVRFDAQIESWNEVGLTALKAASNAKRAHGRLDAIHCPAIDLVHGHEQAFHPNEVKRLELQKQNQETEAQAARKAINPELI